MDTDTQKIKTVRYEKTLKNGDVYIYERRYYYDKNTKNTKYLKAELIGKKSPGSDKIEPTRPKKKFVNAETTLNASRHHVGMMDILDFVGKDSGIDSDLYAISEQNPDLKGTVQKILSVARYIAASQGSSLTGISSFQINHSLPYSDFISEDTYHELFRELGFNEQIKQSYFYNRISRLGKDLCLAYDSTTISTYSQQQISARYGFNKDNDGLKTIKFLTLYSLKTSQPVCYTKQPGNIADVTAVSMALSQLEALGAKTAEVITDNGFYSQQNIVDFYRRNIKFSTLCSLNVSYVAEALKEHKSELSLASNICSFDSSTYGITISKMQDFTVTAKNNSKNHSKNEKITFKKRIYIHLYRNIKRQAEETAKFNAEIMELKSIIENGTPIEELNARGQKLAADYLQIRTYNGRAVVKLNDEAIAERLELKGYFAVVSNKAHDTFEALHNYRHREHIEGFFRCAKQKADFLKPRVWSSDSLDGRMFVQFVALGYLEHLQYKINEAKERLKQFIFENQSVDGKKAAVEERRKLLAWINNNSMKQILSYFDALELTSVNNQDKRVKWDSGITRRDQLFLEILGVIKGS